VWPLVIDSHQTKPTTPQPSVTKPPISQSAIQVAIQTLDRIIAIAAMNQHNQRHSQRSTTNRPRRRSRNWTRTAAARSAWGSWRRRCSSLGCRATCGSCWRPPTRTTCVGWGGVGWGGVGWGGGRELGGGLVGLCFGAETATGGAPSGVCANCSRWWLRSSQSDTLRQPNSNLFKPPYKKKTPTPRPHTNHRTARSTMRSSVSCCAPRSRSWQRAAATSPRACSRASCCERGPIQARGCARLWVRRLIFCY